MSIDLADFQNKARNAIKTFWGKREVARRKQSTNGKADQGERAGVTAGKNMDGFLELVKEIVYCNGLKHADICLGGTLQYFVPQACAGKIVFICLRHSFPTNGFKNGGIFRVIPAD